MPCPQVERARRAGEASGRKGALQKIPSQRKPRGLVSVSVFFSSSAPPTRSVLQTASLVRPDEPRQRKKPPVVVVPVMTSEDWDDDEDDDGAAGGGSKYEWLEEGSDDEKMVRARPPPSARLAPGTFGVEVQRCGVFTPLSPPSPFFSSRFARCQFRCENCFRSHDGSYGKGRFCGKRCKVGQLAAGAASDVSNGLRCICLQR